jgi:hypothetical protein
MNANLHRPARPADNGPDMADNANHMIQKDSAHGTQRAMEEP